MVELEHPSDLSEYFRFSPEPAESPKSVALPVEAIVTYSILLESPSTIIPRVGELNPAPFLKVPLRSPKFQNL